MQLKETTIISQVLQGIFDVYSRRVPDVKKITQAMINAGILQREEDIINDHIAFRTLGVPHLGIQSFEKIFLAHGYQKRDYFLFEGKRLNAYWYSPPEANLPRIFISELRVDDLSTDAQARIQKYTQNISADPVEALNLQDPEALIRFFHEPLWELPSFEDYSFLLEESEYAAWVIYNRYYLNHYTISVHQLPEAYRTLEQFNDFLRSIGIRLNNAGGEIKVSPDRLLRQSSSIAEKVDATFKGGVKAVISGSYVEFAERLPLPEFQNLPHESILPEMRRDGFESGNADKIFESTFTSQTNRT